MRVHVHVCGQVRVCGHVWRVWVLLWPHGDTCNQPQVKVGRGTAGLLSVQPTSRVRGGRRGRCRLGRAGWGQPVPPPAWALMLDGSSLPCLPNRTTRGRCLPPPPSDGVRLGRAWPAVTAREPAPWLPLTLRWWAPHFCPMSSRPINPFCPWLLVGTWNLPSHPRAQPPASSHLHLPSPPPSQRTTDEVPDTTWYLRSHPQMV